MQPQKSPFSWRGALALATLCLLGAILGCGSARRAADSSAAAGGSAVIAITWPETVGRVIPAETKRIVIRVVGESELPHLRKEVVRTPGSTKESVTLEGLPFQSLLFLVEAYGEAAQTPIALGGRTVEIQRGVRASVDIHWSKTAAAGRLPARGAVVLVRDVPGANHVSLLLPNGQVIPTRRTAEHQPHGVQNVCDRAILPSSLPATAPSSRRRRSTRPRPLPRLAQRDHRSSRRRWRPWRWSRPHRRMRSPHEQAAGDDRNRCASINNIAQGDALAVVDPMPRIPPAGHRGQRPDRPA